MQIWISTHSGVISKRPPPAYERFPFIKTLFTPPAPGCKAPFGRIFQLAAVQAVVLASPASAQGWAVSAIQVEMQQVARETWVAFERRLERAGVPAPQRPDYHKWSRFYLDFCHKYSHPPRSASILGPFLSKLATKNQSVERRPCVLERDVILTGSPVPSALQSVTCNGV